MQKYHEVGQLNHDLRDLALYGSEKVIAIEVSPLTFSQMCNIDRYGDPHAPAPKEWLGYSVEVNHKLPIPYKLTTCTRTKQECKQRDAALHEVRELINT